MADEGGYGAKAAQKRVERLIRRVYAELMPRDPTLEKIVTFLRTRFRCHTVVLYGSRARGTQTATSDYDAFGVRRSGTPSRVARMNEGRYWDLFVYPEKDLKKLGEEKMHWKNARLLYSKGAYGHALLKRIARLERLPFRPMPRSEIEVLKVWSRKQLERIQAADTHGFYRRAELLASLPQDYFKVRRKRYPGPKAALLWLERNDRLTLKLFEKALSAPNDDTALKRLVARAYLTSAPK